jgi:hypothetical protein
VTEALLLITATERPPVGAAFDRVTVQVVDAPELTEDGEQVRDETVAGATRVSVAAPEVPFKVAVTCAVASAAIEPTEAVKPALV